MPKKTKTNKAGVILDLIDRHPTWNTADIAKTANTSASYVHKVRKDWLDSFTLTADMEEPAADPVNSPPHYMDGRIETIDYIRAKLSEEEFVGYCRGNALKYLSRAGKKGGALEDHRKAVWYLSYLEEHAA